MSRKAIITALSIMVVIAGSIALIRLHYKPSNDIAVIVLRSPASSHLCYYKIKEDKTLYVAKGVKKVDNFLSFPILKEDEIEEKGKKKLSEFEFQSLVSLISEAYQHEEIPEENLPLVCDGHDMLFLIDDKEFYINFEELWRIDEDDNKYTDDELIFLRLFEEVIKLSPFKVPYNI